MTMTTSRLRFPLSCPKLSVVSLRPSLRQTRMIKANLRPVDMNLGEVVVVWGRVEAVVLGRVMVDLEGEEGVLEEEEGVMEEEEVDLEVEAEEVQEEKAEVVDVAPEVVDLEEEVLAEEKLSSRLVLIQLLSANVNKLTIYNVVLFMATSRFQLFYDKYLLLKYFRYRF